MMTLRARFQPGPLPSVAPVGSVGLGFEGEDVGEGEAEHGGAADAQKFAAGHAVAGGFILGAGDHEHRRFSVGGIERF